MGSQLIPELAEGGEVFPGTALTFTTLLHEHQAFCALLGIRGVILYFCYYFRFSHGHYFVHLHVLTPLCLDTFDSFILLSFISLGVVYLDYDWGQGQARSLTAEFTMNWGLDTLFLVRRNLQREFGEISIPARRQACIMVI